MRLHRFRITRNTISANILQLYTYAYPFQLHFIHFQKELARVFFEALHLYLSCFQLLLSAVPATADVTSNCAPQRGGGLLVYVCMHVLWACKTFSYGRNDVAVATRKTDMQTEQTKSAASRKTGESKRQVFITSGMIRTCILLTCSDTINN